MKEFSEVHGFPILLDEKGLEDETVTAEEPITPDVWLNAGGTCTMSVVYNRNEQMVWVIAAPFETHLEIQSLLNTLALQGDKAMSKPAYYIPGYGGHSQSSSVRSSRLRRSNLGDPW
ncbi:MAG: hypothetical protein WCP62_01670 [Planctomycetota bacterium]